MRLEKGVVSEGFEGEGRGGGLLVVGGEWGVRRALLFCCCWEDFARIGNLNG